MVSNKQGRRWHKRRRDPHPQSAHVATGRDLEHLLNLHYRPGHESSDLELGLYPSTIMTTAMPYPSRTPEYSKMHLRFMTDSKYLVRVNIAGFTGDVRDRVRFISRTEKVELGTPEVKRGDHRFITMSHHELERYVGHSVLLGEDGPVLSDNDRNVLNAVLVTKEMYKAHPKLRPEIRRALTEHEQQTNRSLRREEIYHEMVRWLETPLRLQRPDGSALGKFMEAAGEGRVWIPLKVTHPNLDESVTDKYARLDVTDVQSMVIEHDWSGVLSNATIVGEGGGEIEMPYPMTCFEFVVSGRRTLAIVAVATETHPWVSMTLMSRHGDDWAYLTGYRFGDDWSARPNVDQPDSPDIVRIQPLADLVTRNIHAVCVLLETEIVEREAVRVDARLNQARVKRGKLPLHDYHVVALSRRERVKPRSLQELDPDREITHRRWHLVRAHWRQYARHRTRVPWHSRGDLELGIVDKHYRL